MSYLDDNPSEVKNAAYYRRELKKVEEKIAELEAKLEGGEPVAWRTFDGEGNYDFRSYEGNKGYKDWYATYNPKYPHWCEPLYLHPTPNASAEPKHGLPGFVTPGFSRREWHDKAWALFNTKTFDDTQLSKVNMHTMRAVFDATFDALNEATPNASVEMERDADD